MGATENDCIDLRVALKQTLDIALDEIVGTRGIELIVLNERYPHRTGLRSDNEVGVEFGNLELVGTTADGARGGNDTNVAGVSQQPHDFGGRTNDTQNATRREARGGLGRTFYRFWGKEKREVALLDRS